MRTDGSILKQQVKIGDLVRLQGQYRVYRVTGFHQGSDTIPEGFLRAADVTDDGHESALNPDHVKKYNGAVSCFPK